MLIVFSVSVKNAIGVLVGIALNEWVPRGRKDKTLRATTRIRSERLKLVESEQSGGGQGPGLGA